MKARQPRLRMLAGPNGSGKSTLKNVIGPKLLGAFINADELEAKANNLGFVDFSDYQLTVDPNVLAQYSARHDVLINHHLDNDIPSLPFENNCLLLNRLKLNSYHASALCNFIRDELFKAEKSFSFETVMSHESKVHLLRNAQKLGYRTYLYFVGTESPDINVVRVKERVEKGGHPVPEDKIRSRYERSINFLYDAIGFANRAYIFDNSHEQHEPILVAEYNGEELIARVDAIPYWLAETWERF